MRYLCYVGNSTSASFSDGGVESCATRHVEAKVGEEYDRKENEDAECQTLSHEQPQRAGQAKVALIGRPATFRQLASRLALATMLNEGVARIEGDGTLPSILRNLWIQRDASSHDPGISTRGIQIDGVQHKPVCLVYSAICKLFLGPSKDVGNTVYGSSSRKSRTLKVDISGKLSLAPHGWERLQKTRVSISEWVA